MADTPAQDSGEGMLNDVMVNVDKTREDMVRVAVLHMQMPNFKYTLTLHLFEANILDSFVQVKKAVEELIGEIEKAIQRGDTQLALPTSANLGHKPQQIVIPGSFEEIMKMLGEKP